METIALGSILGVVLHDTVAELTFDPAKFTIHGVGRV
jgi:hypothetical protein